MNSKSTLPVIAGVTIRADQRGLLNLNDLHQAAGGEDRHKPAQWLRMQKTQEYVSYLQEKHGKQAVSSSQGGEDRGTFVHENLVYSYAMWVSVEFHDQVIEAFKALLAGDVKGALSAAQMGRLIVLEQCKQSKNVDKDTIRVWDLEIAKLTGDTETAARIQADIDAETHWRENTAQGWAETFFATVGPGFSDNVTVPAHLKVDDVIRCAKRFFKEKGITLEIEKYGSSQFWFETLY